MQEKLEFYQNLGGLTGMRYYDEFDYVKWFNGE